MRRDAPWCEFDAALEPLEWGEGTYVIVALPEALVEAAATARTRPLDTVDRGLGI